MADRLVETLGYAAVSVRRLLESTIAEGVLSRREMQSLGAEVERRTAGAWIADAVEQWTRERGRESRLVVDALRTESQLDQVALRFGKAVVHVHLTAHEDRRRQRFELRRERGQADAGLAFDQASAHATELGADALRSRAHLVLDTTDLPEDAMHAIARTYLEARRRGRTEPT